MCLHFFNPKYILSKVNGNPRKIKKWRNFTVDLFLSKPQLQNQAILLKRWKLLSFCWFDIFNYPVYFCKLCNSLYVLCRPPTPVPVRNGYHESSIVTSQSPDVLSIDSGNSPQRYGENKSRYCYWSIKVHIYIILRIRKWWK